MKNILKSKVFIGTFLVTYFSFFILTILVLDIKSEGLGVGHWGHGFPFTYYYSSCWGGAYIWGGLIGNIFTAGILGVAGGVFSVYSWKNHLIPFWQKVSSEEFRTKWHI